MRRRFHGLHRSSEPAEIAAGLYLVRVENVQYHWSVQKPFYVIRFRILEPKSLLATFIDGRVYCTTQALWKLSWFLRDFGYDAELLGRDELDEQALIGLTGVVKVSQALIHGTSLLNLDGFAPAAEWQKLSAATQEPTPEVA